MICRVAANFWREAGEITRRISAVISPWDRNELPAKKARNPRGGMFLGIWLCRSLLTDPLWDMLVPRFVPYAQKHFRAAHHSFAIACYELGFTDV
jgi:hypothetical protein